MSIIAFVLGAAGLVAAIRVSHRHAPDSVVIALCVLVAVGSVIILQKTWDQPALDWVTSITFLILCAFGLRLGFSRERLWGGVFCFAVAAVFAWRAADRSLHQ